MTGRIRSRRHGIENEVKHEKQKCDENVHYVLYGQSAAFLSHRVLVISPVSEPAPPLLRQYLVGGGRVRN